MGDRCTNKDIIHAIGVLEGKLDGIIKTLNDHHDRMNRIDEDIEQAQKRLNKVELRQQGIATKITMAAAFIAVVIGSVLRKVFDLF